MRILVDDRWTTHQGIGRFAREVLRRLDGVAVMDLRGRPQDPFDPFRLTVALSRATGDIFFTPGYNVPLVTNLPFVFTLHDLLHLQYDRSALKAQYYNLIVRPAARKCRCLLTVSESSRSDILAWARIPSERVVVVGNGVGMPFCPQGPKYASDSPYILYVGNTKPHKNVERLLRGFARSRAATTVALLLRCSESKPLIDIISSLRIQAKVRFLAPVPDAKLAAMYRGAQAVVVPSLAEGFGLPSLEAMACGARVVVSDIPSLREIVGPFGIYVDPEQVDSIAVAIDSAVYSREGDNERVMQVARARSFSWEQVAMRVASKLRE